MPSTYLWCLTLPLIDQQPLSEDERQALRRLRVRALWCVALWVAAALVVFYCWGAALSRIDVHHATLAMVVLLAGLAACIACCVQGYRCIQRAGLLRRELRDGTLQHFAGDLHQSDNPRLVGSIERFLGNAGVTPGVAETHLDVYGGSGRVAGINTRPYRGRSLVLTRRTTAEPPDFAAIAAQWLEKIGETGDGTTVMGGRRELSPAEIAELRCAATQAWWTPARWPVLIALWPGALALIALVTGNSLQMPCLYLLCIAAMSTTPIMRGVLFARQLSAAGRNGMVSIIQYLNPPDTEPDPAPQDATLESGVVAEVLPGTKIPWTLNGTPAVWRRV